MRSKFLTAAYALPLFLLLAPSVHAAVGFKLGIPGPEDAPQLVTPGPDPVIRIPVAHQHAASGCVGYLYFSRKTMRYEVLHPDRDKVHSFEKPMADLMVAKQWTFLGSAMPEAEFKFRDGTVYHFFRVKKKMTEASNEKLGWDDALPWDVLIDAATKFDVVVSQVLQANAAQTAAAAAAAAPAAPPVDDSTAMDSSGLEVPPPPPWGQPAPGSPPAVSPGTGRP
jgi:hypothetical protein